MVRQKTPAPPRKAPLKGEGTQDRAISKPKGGERFPINYKWIAKVDLFLPT